MQIGRRAIMVTGTFFLAAATGHVMQNGDAISARLRGAALVAAPEGLVLTSLTSASTETGASAAVAPGAAAALAKAVSRSVPDFPEFPAIRPATLGSDMRFAARVNDTLSDYQRPETLADREFDAYGLVCAEPAVTLTHRQPAMLELALTAPCHAAETLRISHAGMSFAVMTDDKGSYRGTIPALAAKGEVTLRLARGADLTAARLVPDLGAVRRFAIAARGPSGLHLNAYLNGAVAGDDGHIRPDNPGLPAPGSGGFLTGLGDAGLPQPMLAEVFTSPANTPAARIEVVAAVGGGNCGRDVLGTTFTADGTVVPQTGAISFAMPGCDALGDLLVMDVSQAATAVALASAQR